MEISGDGRTWIPVGEHRLGAASPPVAIPVAPPVRPVQPVEVVEEVGAVPLASRRDRERRRPLAPTRSSGGGLKALGVVVGIGVIGAIAVFATKGDDRTATSNASSSRAPLAVPPASSEPVPPEPLRLRGTKAEFRAHWTQYWEKTPLRVPKAVIDQHKFRFPNRPMPEKLFATPKAPFAFGETVDDAAAVFKAAAGGRDPDRTQTLDDRHYWYFTCSDGTIQLVWVIAESYWKDPKETNNRYAPIGAVTVEVKAVNDF